MVIKEGLAPLLDSPSASPLFKGEDNYIKRGFASL